MSFESNLPQLKADLMIPSAPSAVKTSDKKLQSCVTIKGDEHLTKGETLLKCCRRGRLVAREFRLSADLSQLLWKSENAFREKFRFRPSLIDLTTVERIQCGQSTAKFSKMKGKVQGEKDLCFSIVCNNGRTLDIVCKDELQLQIWKDGLNSIVSRLRDARSEDLDKAYIRQQWILADVDHNGVLSINEAIKLANALNSDKTKQYIRKCFKEVDVDNSGALDFEEFCEFLERLRERKEIMELWDSLTSGGEEDIFLRKLDTKQFQMFLSEVQGETRSVEECESIFLCHEQNNLMSSKNKLSYNGFLSYLSGVENDIFKPEMLRLYQDMTQPLSHYYIASSHNTYLEGDQLKSNSSVNTYINCLLKGCRCVELDCWDGDNNDPIIYHGHTLTSKIKFKAVIEAINQHAFKSSPFPVILSLENHCSYDQQVVMARYMKSIFKEKLFYLDKKGEEKIKELPSPEELKYKILLKGKKSKSKSDKTELDEDIDEDDFDEEFENPVAVMNEAEENKVRPVMKRKPSGSKDGKEKKPKIAPELADICFIKGIHFSNFESSRSIKCFEMSSFSETKTQKYLNEKDGKKNKQVDWIEYNRTNLSRIYPAGFRVDSSNYNPIPSWNAGSQIVALNYQTSDWPMRLNQGKFMENANCGYLLKQPQLRLDPQNAPERGPDYTMTIRVISGQQLPKPAGERKGEVIDPYVKIACYSGSQVFNKQTKIIQDNGLNPIWDEEFSFRLTGSLESTLIMLTVMDKDDLDEDDFIGYNVTSAHCMRTGYRRIPLFSMEGSRLGSYEFATLFCKVKLEECSN